MAAFLNSGFATALGGGVAAVLGVVVGRLLRMSGALTGYSEPWDLSFEPASKDFYGGEVSGALDELEEGDEPSGARFVLSLELFNAKEVPVGLRGVRVEVVREDGTSFRVGLRDMGTTRVVHSLTISDDVDVLNLPPRQFLRKSLVGFLDAGGASVLASGRWRKAEFVGEPPRRRLWPARPFRHTVARP